MPRPALHLTVLCCFLYCLILTATAFYMNFCNPPTRITVLLFRKPSWATPVDVTRMRVCLAKYMHASYLDVPCLSLEIYVVNITHLIYINVALKKAYSLCKSAVALAGLFK